MPFNVSCTYERKYSSINQAAVYFQIEQVQQPLIQVAMNIKNRDIYSASKSSFL